MRTDRSFFPPPPPPPPPPLPDENPTRREETEMSAAFRKIFCCYSTTASEVAAQGIFDGTTSEGRGTPLPSYEEAIRQTPVTSRPSRAPPRTAPASAQRTTRSIVNYNSYMAAVAFPPKLDPIMRLASRRRRRRRPASIESDISTLTADTSPGRIRWINRNNIRLSSSGRL